MTLSEKALELHEAGGGKLEVISKVSVANREELSLAYTPGVAEPCKKIKENPDDVWRYTSKKNMVAVISNGTAVLGLGNIGAAASLPVMEGKSILLKQFGGVDSFPLCLDTKDKDELIRTVKILAPGFGGINLEDIASPDCFEIEEILEREMDIPVFHDDQHGTAIVVTAALVNALKLVGKKMEEVKIVLSGPGAAGTAIIKMLLHAGAKNIIACDEHGILYKNRPAGLLDHKAMLVDITNPDGITGTLADAVKGADVFVGVSAPRVLTPEMIGTMASDSIVYAMANPEPEISYAEGKKAGVRVMGTGRSDAPNQVNNLMAFPGIFKGALSVRARDINPAMKLAAVNAIADCIPENELSDERIVPDIFDPKVTENVAAAVAKAARETGVARI